MTFAFMAYDIYIPINSFSCQLKNTTIAEIWGYDIFVLLPYEAVSSKICEGIALCGHLGQWP